MAVYVANNTITDGPHAGITGGGLLNLFEHNAIKRVCFGSIDVGAFYVAPPRHKPWSIPNAHALFPDGTVNRRSRPCCLTGRPLVGSARQRRALQLL